MELTLRNISEENPVDFLITYENRDRKHTLYPGAETLITLHFSSSNTNEASISIQVVDETSEPVKANYYTIFSVADFCTFQLKLIEDYSEYLEIVEARPDFVRLLKRALKEA